LLWSFFLWVLLFHPLLTSFPVFLSLLSLLFFFSSSSSFPPSVV
jgi:hypothetical protein